MTSLKSRRRAGGRSANRSGFTIGATALLIVGLVGNGAITANAKDLDDYATWDDVVAAQNDIDAQNALIDEINGQIQELETQVAEAEEVAEAAGAAYSQAEAASTSQGEKVYSLQTQADAAAAEADEAESEAAGYVAAMADRVPVDPTVELLTNPDDADGFLMGMSTLSKLGTQNGAVYENAVAARNNANSLADQAQVALEELEELEAEAQANYQAAVDAQLDLQAARDEKTEKGSELEAMLAPLEEHREVVAADYQEGERLREEERKRIEEEQRKAAEEAAAAAAAAQAAAEKAQAQANQNASSGGSSGSSGSSGGSSGGGGGGGSEAPTGSGYVPPLGYNAYITSPYGWRIHPVYGYSRLHNGTDFVVPGGTCGTPIYAVSAGTVTYAAWLDGWGNRVDYQLDDGTTLGNAHIMPGGIMVYPGQRVAAGQIIAYAGTTGPSTGCHLHFMVNNGAVDPVGWLAARGIYY
ncbi:M23 family metallopeptidase [Gulosibacter faecalis]|jgi:murein DD-endopeptidase MepM/ murein hydrolase activator NlpD|uniref:M23 family metallopeptidase n=1 Tax=Gulosibacter faecalis TaxID=272240 RepID=A0ABW5UUF3_9MICO|nr:M23 family metallopeptidase [Gulosibacter faecalis]